jgi:DNA-binding NarL/FixJ family response regulator
LSGRIQCGKLPVLIRQIAFLEAEHMVNVPRVILADDHKLVAEALRKLIAPQFEVVAIASDGYELLEFATALRPDVIVVDVAMPLLNGLEAGRQLKERMPSVKLVFLTMNEDPELALEAMNAGASGYVLKKSAGTELIEALAAAVRGKSYVTRQIARGMQESFARNPHGRMGPRSVTRRQRQVVQLLAEGKSMKEAADVLKVTPRTVAFHKYRLMQDLGLKTNADVVQFAIKNRIIV